MAIDEKLSITMMVECDYTRCLLVRKGKMKLEE
jgi:hypothetical protein